MSVTVTCVFLLCLFVIATAIIILCYG